MAAARAWPQDLAGELELLGGLTLSERGAIAHAIVDAHTPGMALADARALAARFRLTGRDAFAQLAQPLVERHGHAPLEALKTFGSVANGLVDLKCDFELHGRPAFSVLAEALLEAHPPAPEHQRLVRRLSQALAAASIDTDQKLVLAQQMAGRSDAHGLLPMLDSLGCNDDAVVCRLARDLASRCKLSDEDVAPLFIARESLRLAVALGQQVLVLEGMRNGGSRSTEHSIELSPSGDCHLLAQGIHLASGLRGTRFKSMGEVLEFARSSWAPMWEGVNRDGPQDTPEALQLAFQTLEPHPLLVDIFEKAQAQTNPRLQGDRMAWTLDLAACLNTLPDADLHGLASDLTFLNTLHAPALRRQLTDSLIGNVHAHGSASGYADFAAAFSRPHMRGFAMALYPLYAADGEVPPERLMTALRHDRLKDSRRLHAALGDVLKLVESTHRLAPSVVRQLIERAVPEEDTAQQRCDGLRQTLRLTAVLVQSLDMSADAELERSLVDLSDVPPGADLGQRMKPMLRRLMPGRGAAMESTSAQASWDRLLFDSRQTEAVLVYKLGLAAALHGGAHGEGLDEVLDALDRYADAALWSTDPTAEFARIRYAPEASPHLAHLAEQAPAAYQTWREVVEPQSPLRLGALTATDTDRADDLLLCGTEVAGSCQTVNDKIDNNKALMGYVLDGKYRMLALQGDDGTTHARRMMRLLVDEHTGQPVLFIEKLYANAGIDEYGPEDQALIEMARSKATAMGCPIVCSDDEGMAGAAYPGPVISLGNPAPFEFVDADDVGLVEGRYKLDGLLLQSATEIDRVWRERGAGDRP
ncbi:hypothetical protein ASC87_09800 [Rhizobacter sp. Root1221]|nr:hypothetical protein ASC87_09800 [Rhizobacter sp. Root1221]